jgi:hypothetical protein
LACQIHVDDWSNTDLLDYTLSMSTYGEKKENKAKDYFAQKKLNTSGPGGKEYCLICNEVLYNNEKISIDQFTGKIFHITCFKCKYCKCKLGTNNWGQLGNDFFCKAHTIELFKKSGGKYDGKDIVDKETELKQAMENPVVDKTTTPDYYSMGSSVTTPNAMDKYKLDTDEQKVTTPTVPSYQDRINETTPSTMQTQKRVVTPQVSTPGKDYCVVCSKTVYQNERMSVDGKIFHSDCFRCRFCKNKLSSGSYHVMKGEYYCKPHYLELYMKGGYDGGHTLEKSEEIERRGSKEEEQQPVVQSRPSYRMDDSQEEGEIKSYKVQSVQKPVSQQWVDPDQSWKGQSTSPVIKPVQSSQNTNGMSSDDNEALTKLSKLRDSGILTDEEYNFKAKQIQAKYAKESSQTQTTSAPINAGSIVSIKYTKEDEDLLGKLSGLVTLGILTEDEKKQKIEMIDAKYNTVKTTTKTVTLSQEDTEAYVKLQKLKDVGVLTQEEFDFKANQIKAKYK